MPQTSPVHTPSELDLNIKASKQTPVESIASRFFFIGYFVVVDIIYNAIYYLNTVLFMSQESTAKHEVGRACGFSLSSTQLSMKIAPFIAQLGPAPYIDRIFYD